MLEPVTCREECPGAIRLPRKAKNADYPQGHNAGPVTPFKDDFSFDASAFEKMVDFHVRNGAPAITWPYHKSESLNLTIAERKLGAKSL